MSAQYLIQRQCRIFNKNVCSHVHALFNLIEHNEKSGYRNTQKISFVVWKSGTDRLNKAFRGF